MDMALIEKRVALDYNFFAYLGMLRFRQAGKTFECSGVVT